MDTNLDKDKFYAVPGRQNFFFKAAARAAHACVNDDIISLFNTANCKKLHIVGIE